MKMGGGGQQTEPVSGKGTGFFTWEEVQKHSNRNDQWLVVKRKVYNVTNWAKRHPGGFRVINHYAGEDATVSIFHLFMVVRTIEPPFCCKFYWDSRHSVQGFW